MNRGIVVLGVGSRVATARLLLISSSAQTTNTIASHSNLSLSPYCPQQTNPCSTKTILLHHHHYKTPLLFKLPLISSSSIMSQTHSSSGVSAGVSTASFQNGGDSTLFPLSPPTVLKINKGDITKWFVNSSSDAIVNPANERMLGGAGADGAIHRAAGPELRDACYNVPEVRPGVRCPTGEARITQGFKLPASHVIHTVGPIYNVDSNPEASLRNAYRNSLTAAKDNNIKFIAFPAISCGVYGYPFEEAATVAISTVKEFTNDFEEVHFVLFSDEIYKVWLDKAKELLQA